MFKFVISCLSLVFASFGVNACDAEGLHQHGTETELCACGCGCKAPCDCGCLSGKACDCKN